ncbi:TRAP-type C4-dicarboxylate transport system permease small subunit [Hoeflea marina]|uniref:TRAP transporter small permease protein n=1 Tax=Hoeflea marina TaxID=274592 RepID=A0A317PGD9_9HYPH|nr:TRAP transporter small permease [Hoeflea marina]PWV99094.1 TRAP-type C4-dicarboxylate transport system permease small subunit [Hoeflea marina]
MKPLRRIIEYVSVFLLGALVFVPFAQIIMRSLFGAPIVGAEEFTRFLLICVVFVSYPLVVEAGENIVMGDLRNALPDVPRRILNLATSIAAIFIACVVAYAAFKTIGMNLNNATPTLKIPFWIFLGSTFFGFASAAVVHLVHLRKPPQKASSVII